MAVQAEKKKLCFVIGPIGDAESETRIHADWLLEEIILPVFAKFENYNVVRADQIAQPGMIDAQIIRFLIDADLVVADLSTLNPNAFYEIGVRHMVQKPIIHMQLADEKIPFDVSLYRATKFSRVRPADLRKAREELKKAVEAISDDGFQVENPVTRARGQIKLEQHATPEQKVILDQVKAIQERLEDLETKYIRERVRAGMPSTAIQSEILTTMYVHLDETVTNRKVVQDVMQTINEIFLQTIFTIQDKVISFELTNKDLRSPAWAQTKERLTRISGVKEVNEFPF